MSGRNPDGTFTEGNTFSDGRNKYARQHELRAQFAAAVTDSEIQRLANKLVAMALDGDMQAAKLLLTTLFKEQSGPAVAVQINQQGSPQERRQKLDALIEKIKGRGITERQQQQRHAAGLHDHRVSDAVLEVQAKQSAAE